MNRRYLFCVALAMAALAAQAQETYENASLARPELNGTARYVGMGGAMEALGADLSTISSNPAGIGLFRHSTANVSFGLVSQQGAKSFDSGNKTNASFDQAGFVYSARTGKGSFLNFAFNYTKSRNFDNILRASGLLGGASQANMAYNKVANGFASIDEMTGNSNGINYYCSQLDYLYSSLMYDYSTNVYYDFRGNDYLMQRANTGYIGRYDFNMSGNVNNTFYWGITVGIHDVHYNGYSEYSESASDNAAYSGVLVIDSRRITGTGFDVKAGIIFRPVAESPFRIGLSVASPIMYDLKTTNTTGVMLYDTNYSSAYNENGDTYEFRLNTPWKFGVSLGHTVGNYLALGASYEFADYGAMDTRVKDGYDYYGNERSYSDDAMNRHTKSTLKGVSTIKVGAELKPDPALAIRVGFNYVSSMYDKNAYKDGTVYSPGTYYQSATDFTNWDDTYRLTAGLGYRKDKFNVDLAYQYSTTNGKFTPFVDGTYTLNSGETVKVNDRRHQLIMTLGYTF